MARRMVFWAMAMGMSAYHSGYATVEQDEAFVKLACGNADLLAEWKRGWLIASVE